MRASITTIATASLALAVLAGDASARLWDRDEKRVPASAGTSAEDVLVGRIDRHPPLFYEMRLARVEQSLAADPTRWSDYDDAAVACDRLGRFDEALAWLKRKESGLAMLPKSQDTVVESYAYHTIRGSVLVHRWLSGNGAGPLADLLASSSELSMALAMRRQASPGWKPYGMDATDTEQVESWMVDWLVAVRSSAQPPPLWDDLFVRSAGGDKGGFQVISGLAGLMAENPLWINLDTLSGLEIACAQMHQYHFAGFALYQISRRLRDGEHSLIPNTPGGNEYYQTAGLIMPDLPTPVARTVMRKYKNDIAVARRRREDRTNYEVSRLRGGNHPDVSPYFWIDYHDPSADASFVNDTPDGSTAVAGILLALGAGVGLLVWRDGRASGRGRPSNRQPESE